MKELVIELSLDESGTLEAETFGFKGKICESELIELLQDDFYLDGIDKKDDYFKPVEEDVSNALKTVGRKV